MIMSVAQELMTVILTQDAQTLMGALPAAVTMGTVVMESAVKVNFVQYCLLKIAI